MPKQEGFPKEDPSPDYTPMTPEKIAQSREKLSKLAGSGIEAPKSDIQQKVEQAEKEAALKDLIDFVQRANLTTEDLKDLYNQATEMVGDNYHIQRGEKSILPDEQERAKQFKGSKKRVRALRATMEAEKEKSEEEKNK